jgi:hypothetical protein
MLKWPKLCEARVWIHWVKKGLLDSSSIFHFPRKIKSFVWFFAIFRTFDTIVVFGPLIVWPGFFGHLRTLQSVPKNDIFSKIIKFWLFHQKYLIKFHVLYLVWKILIFRIYIGIMNKLFQKKRKILEEVSDLRISFLFFGSYSIGRMLQLVEYD